MCHGEDCSRPFHTRGPATAKLLSPNRCVCVEQCMCCRMPIEQTAITVADEVDIVSSRRAGAWPDNDWHATLYPCRSPCSPYSLCASLMQQPPATTEHISVFKEIDAILTLIVHTLITGDDRRSCVERCS